MGSESGFEAVLNALPAREIGKFHQSFIEFRDSDIDLKERWRTISPTQVEANAARQDKRLPSIVWLTLRQGVIQTRGGRDD
jgi:hypothetical protein